MRQKSILVHLLVFGLALSALTPITQIQNAEAPAPSLSTCPVPETATTVGGKWDGSFMWLASYKYGALYKINMTNCAYTQYYYLGVNDTSFSVRFRGMDMDANGNFWIVRLSGGLVFFDKSTSTFQDVISTNWQAQNVKVISGKAYVAADLGAGADKLYIVDVASKTVESQISLTGGSATVYDGYVKVGDNIWLTDNENGRLIRYSTVNSTIKNFVYSQVSQPLGIDYSAPYLYMGDETQQKIIAIHSNTGDFVKTYNINGQPYMIKAVSFLDQDFVAYSTWSGTTKGVGVLNLTITAHTTSVYYCDYDPTANKVYCAYHGSPAGALQGSDFLPVPQPPQQPGQPPAQKPGEGDQRQPIGAINLSGDFVAKRRESLNITVSLSKTVDGHVNLYSGENYIGREFLGSVRMDNSTTKTISFEPDWIGSKSVFVMFSGDSKYKGNVSQYITLTSVAAKTGAETIKSSVNMSRTNILVQIQNLDRYYIQNITVLVQIKNDRGEVAYLAWVRDLQLIPDGSGSLGFGFATEIPRGLIEVYVWKSLEEAIPLAEVSKTRN